MKISVIIPTLNEEESIGKLLVRLGKRSGERLHEIIIADGGSTDQTTNIARKHHARVVECEKKGRGYQLNRGAEEASGEILYFLHADTLPPENFDLLICDSIDKGFPSGCFRLNFDDPHPLLRFFGWCTRFKTDLFRFGDQSLFITRRLYDQTGGYKETMKVMEDHEFVRRIRMKDIFDLREENVLTSARNYRKNGVVRLQFLFILIVILYYAGARQETLVAIYRELIQEA